VKRILVLAILWLATCSSIFSQPALRPYVSVIGEADLEVTPDLVIFSLQLTTLDKDLIRAKKLNDENAVKTLAAARSHAVPDGDVETRNFFIKPKHTTAGDGKVSVFLGYEVEKTLIVTLRDLKKIDSLLNGFVTSGVNKISNVSFDNSKMCELREQVRAMAVRNASEKAHAYAKQLGLKVGRALSVREDGADSTDFGSGSGSGFGAGSGDDSWSDPNGLIANSVTFAIGKISIEDKIYVIFALDQ
jgi:uncharacterized protein YggE